MAWLRKQLQRIYHSFDPKQRLYSTYSPAEVTEIARTLEERYPVEQWMAGGVPVWPLIKCNFCNGELAFLYLPSLLQRFAFVIAKLVCRVWKEKKESSSSSRSATAHSNEIYNFITHPEKVGEAEILLKDNTASNGQQGESRGMRFVYPLEKSGYKIIRVVDEIPCDPCRWCQPMLELRPVEPPADYLSEPFAWVDTLDGIAKRYRCPGSRSANYVRCVLYNSELLVTALQKTKIRYVFLVAWYSPMGFALCIACHRLGIPCIDIEHGIVSHAMYWNWMKEPCGGYPMLPDFFWVWSNDIKVSILEHNRKTSLLNERNIVVGGNWNVLADLQELRHTDLYSYQTLRDRINGRKVVLIGLSVMNDEMYETIRNAALATGDEFFWLFRFHYRYPIERKKYTMRIQDEMKSVGWDVDRGCSLSVCEVLSLADVFVSESSTMFQEALAWGAPGVMLSPEDAIGLGCFRPSIDDGCILPCANGGDFLDILRQALYLDRGRCRKSAEHYFAAADVAVTELNRILQVAP